MSAGESSIPRYKFGSCAVFIDDFVWQDAMKYFCISSLYIIAEK